MAKIWLDTIVGIALFQSPHSNHSKSLMTNLLPWQKRIDNVNIIVKGGLSKPYLMKNWRKCLLYRINPSIFSDSSKRRLRRLAKFISKPTCTLQPQNFPDVRYGLRWLQPRLRYLIKITRKLLSTQEFTENINNLWIGTLLKCPCQAASGLEIYGVFSADAFVMARLHKLCNYDQKKASLQALIKMITETSMEIATTALEECLNKELYEADSIMASYYRLTQGAYFACTYSSSSVLWFWPLKLWWVTLQRWPDMRERSEKYYYELKLGKSVVENYQIFGQKLMKSFKIAKKTIA